MKQVDTAVAGKLQEIVDLQTEIKLQEDKYNSLLKADETFEKLKEIKLKIKHLKTELKAKEDNALTLFKNICEDKPPIEIAGLNLPPKKISVLFSNG